MKVIELDKPMSEEEYFIYEEKSELKHELINNDLYEMSGVSIFHNNIVGNLYLLFRSLLKGTDMKVAFEAFRIKVPSGNFFYPGIAVFRAETNKYYTDNPVLIVEVLSEATRRFDITDKFLQYQKIETLSYYLCIEPEQQVVIFYFKQDDGEWMTETFTKDDQVISFPKLNISFTIRDVYNP